MPTQVRLLTDTYIPDARISAFYTTTDVNKSLVRPHLTCCPKAERRYRLLHPITDIQVIAWGEPARSCYQGQLFLCSTGKSVGGCP